MPLGQAPYGSRQTPPGEEPPEDPGRRGDRLVRQGSWIFFLGGGLIIALVATRSGAGRVSDRKEHGPVGPSPCLTERSCAAGWKCFSIPKDDPFVVEGECAQTCEGDLQCPAQFQCTKVSVAKGQVVPVGARGSTSELTGVCRPAK